MVVDDVKYGTQRFDGSVWFFDPKRIAPIVLAAIFGVSGLVHAWQCCRYKCWKLTGWAVAGALVYSGSLIARIIGAKDYRNLTIYVVHFNLAHAAPPPLELVNFYTLAPAALFHVRSRGPRTRHRTNPVLWTLRASSLLILTRTVFRIIELFGLNSFRPFDTDGNAVTISDPSSVSAVVRFEWPFYAFDAGALLLNLILLHASHPRRYLPQGRSVYLAQDGVTELEGPGSEDDRNLCVVLADPLDLMGLVRGTDKATRFWEHNGFGERGSGDTRGEHALGNETTQVHHEGRRKR